MTRVPVITVDGASGVGKGTVCGFLSNKLGWHFLESGVLYRSLAYATLQKKFELDDIGSLVSLAHNWNVRFKFSNTDSGHEVILDNQSINDELRTEECADVAAQIATIAEVRKALLGRQRAFLRLPGLIADGRDMGTVVFPDAQLKIYLTADADERAKRRYKQLRQAGIDANLPQLSIYIAERDARDSQREIAPLKPADDAIIIDTAGLDAKAVQEIVWSKVVKVFQVVEVFGD